MLLGGQKTLITLFRVTTCICISIYLTIYLAGALGIKHVDLIEFFVMEMERMILMKTVQVQRPFLNSLPSVLYTEKWFLETKFDHILLDRGGTLLMQHAHLMQHCCIGAVVIFVSLIRRIILKKLKSKKYSFKLGIYVIHIYLKKKYF